MAKQIKTKSIFSANLSELLKKEGLSIRQAAKIADIAPSTIAGWVSGTTAPQDFVALRKLALRLDTSLAFLLTGEEDLRIENPTISTVFSDGGEVFNGICEISIKRLIPRKDIFKEKK